MSTLMVIAGEASGDLHGGAILAALKARRPDVRIVGVGGRHMTPFLDRKLADAHELGVVGFVEVLRHLPNLLALKHRLLEEAQAEGVQLLLTLDYPGFNLNLAASLRRRCPNLRLHHYVCPQVWAWKAGRIPKLGHLLDTLYCLFDFEPELFRGLPVEARFLGNPLVDLVAPEVDRTTFFQEARLDPERPLVALLPGSRQGEVARLMPPLMGLVQRWAIDRPEVQWVIPRAPSLPRAALTPHLKDLPVTVVADRSYAARAHADAALVCSGTATLETALLGTPFAILYRLNPLTLALARRVVKVPHFGLANVVAGRRLVPELLQGEVAPERLAQELLRLLDPCENARLRSELHTVRDRLGAPGAAERVADHVLAALESGTSAFPKQP